MSLHGWFGLLFIIVLKLVRILSVQYEFLRSIDGFVGEWFTPLVWWGYITFLDGYLEQRSRISWFRTYRKPFLLMLISSVGCWYIFEGYNVLIQNWTYINLSSNLIEQYAGKVIAFATIFPGIFFTASALAYFLEIEYTPIQKKPPHRFEITIFLIGCIFLIYPLVFPDPHLFALVWLGFIFLCDPINRRLGKPSLFAELCAGSWTKTWVLLGSGYICGFLWEHWNTWADTYWVYHIPFPTIFKIYEMPILGFLGFGPFALECYVMYHTVRGLILDKIYTHPPEVEDVIFFPQVWKKRGNAKI